MSYYMMGIQFWSEVSLLFALLPLLAVAANRVVRLVSRTSATKHGAGALEPHSRGPLAVSCRMSTNTR